MSVTSIFHLSEGEKQGVASILRKRIETCVPMLPHGLLTGIGGMTIAGSSSDSKGRVCCLMSDKHGQLI